MPQIMKSDSRNWCSRDPPAEDLREASRMEGRSVIVRKHELVQSKLGAPPASLCFFRPSVLCQHGDRFGIECDHSSTTFALRRPYPHRVAHLDYALDDRELVALEIDIAPTQPEHLAATHAGRGR